MSDDATFCEPAPMCPRCGRNPLYRGHCGLCGYTIQGEGMKTTAELAAMYFPNEDHRARAEMLAEHARRAAIEECVAWLRQPASDALNRAADDIRRDLDPLQKRVAFLLDGIADEIAAFLQQNVRDLTPSGR